MEIVFKNIDINYRAMSQVLRVDRQTTGNARVTSWSKLQRLGIRHELTARGSKKEATLSQSKQKLNIYS